MNSRVTQRFRKLMAALPPEVRRQARAAYRQFMENPHHPGLLIAFRKYNLLSLDRLFARSRRNG